MIRPAAASSGSPVASRRVPRRGKSFAAPRTLVVATCLMASAAVEAQFESSPGRADELPASAIHVQEPAADEVAVVINANATFGNHAGIFVGPRLSDPAGSYAATRRRIAGWVQGLADYVRYQTTDGPRIRIYRFRLDPDSLAALASRLPEADRAAPLYCATAVQNAIAGIGPFVGIPSAGWTSPASVARLLDRLLTRLPDGGYCQLPDGTRCATEQ